LTRWLPQVPGVQYAAMTLFSAIIFWLVWRWAPKSKLQLLTILALWGLLVAYHGIHDTTLTLFYFCWLLVEGKMSKAWRWLPAFYLPLLILCLPGEVTGMFLPATLKPVWLTGVDLAITAALLGMLAVAQS